MAAAGLVGPDIENFTDCVKNLLYLLLPLFGYRHRGGDDLDSPYTTISLSQEFGIARNTLRYIHHFLGSGGN